MIENSNFSAEMHQKSKWDQYLKDWLDKIESTQSYARIIKFIDRLLPKVESNQREELEDLAAIDENSFLQRINGLLLPA